MREFASAAAELDGKGILITGGTGSFGRKMAETLLARHAPRRLVIFSRDEFKQVEMEQRLSVREHETLRYFIGDVRDRDRLRMAMRGIDIVIHAAALKHVPTAEYNPIECIHTNVLGAENVIQAAIDAGVEKVVALSTDKAASPANLYGASKLAADKLFIAGNALAGTGGTRFSVVRYGNVVGSRGSVVPLLSPPGGGGRRRAPDHRHAHDALLDHARPGRRLRPLLPADDGGRRDIRAEDPEHAPGSISPAASRPTCRTGSSASAQARSCTRC